MSFTSTGDNQGDLVFTSDAHEHITPGTYEIKVLVGSAEITEQLFTTAVTVTDPCDATYTCEDVYYNN